MFQTGVFAGFWDLGSFVASVPTRWEEVKKPASRIEFPVRTNTTVTGYALALALLFLFQLQMLLWEHRRTGSRTQHGCFVVHDETKWSHDQQQDCNTVETLGMKSLSFGTWI